MGQGARQKALSAVAACAAIAVALTGGRAAADPIIGLPESRWVEPAPADTAVALLAEADVAAVAAAEKAAILPGYDPFEAEPVSAQLGVARIGAVFERGSLAALLRIDLAEATRLDLADLDRAPMATVDAFLDDAALWWRPRRWFDLVAGRQPVPLSRFREVERAQLAAGVVPFVVDRVVPERRWGATAQTDLGALALAAGAYADLDDLERGTDKSGDNPETDPSRDGRALLLARALWAPRAPIRRILAATDDRDPWYDTARPGLGLGSMVRLRDGQLRSDTSLSAQLAWRRWFAVVELLLSAESDIVDLGGSAEVSVLLGRHLLLFGRGDLDPIEDRSAAGGGAAWFVTGDRRNKISAYGWIRRQGDSASPGGGIMVEMQASL